MTSELGSTGLFYATVAMLFNLVVVVVLAGAALLLCSIQHQQLLEKFLIAVVEE